MSFAVSSSSNDSCAITWHQWHDEYPTDKKIGRSSARARSNASGPHGYQSTGLCACCNRYGEVSWIRRLVCGCDGAAGAASGEAGAGNGDEDDGSSVEALDGGLA